MLLLSSIKLVKFKIMACTDLKNWFLFFWDGESSFYRSTVVIQHSTSLGTPLNDGSGRCLPLPCTNVFHEMHDRCRVSVSWTNGTYRELFGSYGSNVNWNKNSSNGMAGGNVHSFNSIPFGCYNQTARWFKSYNF
jgi:hypothetical protein